MLFMSGININEIIATIVPHTINGVSAEFCICFIGKRSEKGKHEQSEYVVESHYKARKRLAHAEFVYENKRNRFVIRLPERHYQKESESDEYGPFVIKFHKVSLRRFCFCP